MIDDDLRKQLNRPGMDPDYWTGISDEAIHRFLAYVFGYRIESFSKDWQLMFADPAMWRGEADGKSVLVGKYASYEDAWSAIPSIAKSRVGHAYLLDALGASGFTWGFTRVSNDSEFAVGMTRRNTSMPFGNEVYFAVGGDMKQAMARVAYMAAYHGVAIKSIGLVGP